MAQQFDGRGGVMNIADAIDQAKDGDTVLVDSLDGAELGQEALSRSDDPDRNINFKIEPKF